MVVILCVVYDCPYTDDIQCNSNCYRTHLFCYGRQSCSDVNINCSKFINVLFICMCIVCQLQLYQKVYLCMMKILLLMSYLQYYTQAYSMIFNLCHVLILPIMIGCGALIFDLCCSMLRSEKACALFCTKLWPVSYITKVL